MPKLVSKRTVIPAGAQSSAASPLQQSRQDRHRGVLSFKTKDGNFGFIAADNKQRIFVSGRALDAAGADIDVGAMLEFSVVVQTDGRPTAGAVMLVERAPEKGRDRHRGLVVSLSQRYGFIKPDTGGPDVFFGTDSIRWAGLEFVVRRGSTVEYALHKHPTGRLTAREIRPVDEATRAEQDRWRSARADEQPRRFG